MVETVSILQNKDMIMLQLIPADDFKRFRDQQIFSREAISAFAKTVRIAPGIVVGRLQNEGELRHNMFNELKEHYVIEG